MSKAIPLESTIQANVGKRLRAMGAWVRKNAPGPWGYSGGTLDFTVCYRGGFIALEVKRPGPRHVFSLLFDCEHCLHACTEQQRNEIERVRKAKGVAHVVTCAIEAEQVLDEVCHKLG